MDAPNTTSLASEEVTRLRYVDALCELYGFEREYFADKSLTAIVDSLDAFQLAAVYELIGV